MSRVQDAAPKAPVRRGERARQRVLRAALEVLAESGTAGFNIESVARAAGASKATIYRHWASPSALLVDAMDAQFQPLPDVSTGSPRADLNALLTMFVSVLSDSPFPKLMAAFIDAAERDPTLKDLHRELTDRRRRPLLRILAEAVQREQIAADADLDLLADLLAGPFFYRRFVAHRTIPPEMVTRVVDLVLESARPPAG